MGARRRVRDMVLQCAFGECVGAVCSGVFRVWQEANLGFFSPICRMVGVMVDPWRYRARRQERHVMVWKGGEGGDH